MAPTNGFPKRRRGRTKLIIIGAVGLVVVAIVLASYATRDIVRIPDGRAVKLDRGADLLVADGKSNLPGNFASIQYAPAQSEYEIAYDTDDGYDQTDARGPHSGAYWKVSNMSPDGLISALQISHFAFDLRTPEALQEKIDFKTRQNSIDAGFDLAPRREKIGGRTAYTFEYETYDGWRMMRAWFFSPRHSYRVHCNIAPDAADGAYEKCRRAVKSFRIHDGD